MKVNSLFAIVLMIASMNISTSPAVAAERTDPYDVCIAISQVNSSNAVVCQQVVSQASFVDPYASSICKAIITYGGSSSNAVTCMQNIANKYYEEAAADVCIAVARNGGSSSNVAVCAANGGNKTYRPNELTLCLNMANGGSSSSTVATCVANAGRPYTGPVQPPPPPPPYCLSTYEIIGRVQRAVSMLSSRRPDTTRIDRAREILNQLIYDLQGCP